MCSSIEAATDRADDAGRWRSRGLTTIVFAERDDGTWRATQRGVDVVGYGATAADAAAAYCRRMRSGEDAGCAGASDGRGLAGDGSA